MKKSKLFIIDYVIYPFNLLVCIGATHKEVVNYLNRRLPYKQKLSDEEFDKLYMNSRGRTVMMEGGQTVMRLKEFKKNDPESMATLQHEIFHAVSFLFDKIGIKLTHDSDEAYAYLIEYLTEQILKKLL